MRSSLLLSSLSSSRSRPVADAGRIDAMPIEPTELETADKAGYVNDFLNRNLDMVLDLKDRAARSATSFVDFVRILHRIARGADHWGRARAIATFEEAVDDLLAQGRVAGPARGTLVAAWRLTLSLPRHNRPYQARPRGAPRIIGRD